MKEKQTNTFADCAILAFILPVLNLNPFLLLLMIDKTGVWGLGIYFPATRSGSPE